MRFRLPPPPLLLAAPVVLCTATCGDPVETNRAPVASAAIPGAAVAVGDSMVLDLTPHFSDPDGDPLVFRAASSDASVATASASGGTATTRGVAKGTATVTVTATDPDGLSASQGFKVTVPNRQPRVTDPIPGQRLFRGDSAMVGVAPHFSDPDDDPLTFKATSSDASVATVSVSGDTVTVLAVGPGGTTATVTATDPDGLSASQDFEITIPNRPPVVADSIAAQELLRDDAKTLDMAAHFDDPDGDSLAFTPASSDSSVVLVSASGGGVKVSAAGLGMATVAVTATDPGGLSASQTFEVTVRPGDRDFLEALYRSTNGDAWVDRSNWLTDRPLDEWYGVRTDPRTGSGHRVIALELGQNNLAGPIPPEIGNLDSLRHLDLVFNPLTGEIPPEIGKLSGLKFLRLMDNLLTGSIPPEIGNLSNLEEVVLFRTHQSGPIPPEIGGLASLRHLGIGLVNLSGSIPPEIGDLTNLETLAITLTGIAGELPPELGNLTNLVELSLAANAIGGPIPPELGNLANLEALFIHGNRLTGEIPPELGNLTNLKALFIQFNQLTGEIPPELGNLASLEEMWGQANSRGNNFTGRLPPELGDLANLRELNLSGNSLSGPIPATFGNLSDLRSLRLADNRLTGDLPPALGGLGDLEFLDLANNDLGGRIPPDFEGLRSLRELTLTGSSKMGSPLPGGLTELEDVRVLLAGGTGLCAPRTPDFRKWLRRIYKARISACGEAAAYLTQAVQSREFPVPLIAGERALLRVFLTADEKNDEDLPGVTVRLYDDDDEIHSKYVAGKPGPIPTTVDEGDLGKSVNAEIPGGMIREDLEMVIEVDSVDASLGVPRRIPEEGRAAIDVDSMPAVAITAIPFLWTSDPDSSIIDIVSDVSEEPMEHELLHPTRALLPVADVEVVAHAPVESSTNSALALLSRTKAIRVLEGGTGYYMGTMAWPVTGAAGVAYTPGRSSFSLPDSGVIAHELGHNMSLFHAPCGRPSGVDPSYPHPDGRTGAWGWDFETETLLSPETGDLMSYCHPRWISDYHFTNAARFRLSDEDDDELPGPPRRSLLLWGGVSGDGTPFLEPAFVVNAPPALPDSAGDHRIEGLRADSTELFSLTFEMLDVADAEGASGFVFVLPAEPGWEDALAIIRLSGPAGSAAIDLETRRPMAILRDRTTGRVRAFLDRLPADTSGFEVHFSRGIPDPAAWR